MLLYCIVLNTHRNCALRGLTHRNFSSQVLTIRALYGAFEIVISRIVTFLKLYRNCLVSLDLRFRFGIVIPEPYVGMYSRKGTCDRSKVYSSYRVGDIVSCLKWFFWTFHMICGLKTDAALSCIINCSLHLNTFMRTIIGLLTTWHSWSLLNMVDGVIYNSTKMTQIE